MGVSNKLFVSDNDPEIRAHKDEVLQIVSAFA